MTCVLIVHHRDLQRQRAIFHAEVFSTMNNYCCSKEFSISHAFVYQSINKYFLSKMCGGHERGTRLSYCVHRGWVDKPNVESLKFNLRIWSIRYISTILMELDCFDNKFYQVGKLVLSRVTKEWIQVALPDGKGGSRIFSMKKSRCKDVRVRAVGAIPHTSVLRGKIFQTWR